MARTRLAVILTSHFGTSLTAFLHFERGSLPPPQRLGLSRTKWSSPGQSPFCLGLSLWYRTCFEDNACRTDAVTGLNSFTPLCLLVLMKKGPPLEGTYCPAVEGRSKCMTTFRVWAPAAHK